MQEDTIFIDVVLPLAVPNLYTYRVPAEMKQAVRIGSRVVVQFGKSKLYTALIRNVHHTAPSAYEARYIESIVDEAPVVNEIQFSFWDWIASYYMCHTGEVMNAALPAGLKLSSETKIVLNAEYDFSNLDLNVLTEKESMVIEALQSRTTMLVSEIADLLKVKNPQPVIRSLREKRLVVNYEEVSERYKPRIIPYVRLSEDFINDEEKLAKAFDSIEAKAPKQLQALLFYLNKTGNINGLKKALPIDRWIKKSDLLKASDTGAVNGLVKKGLFEQQEFEISRLKIEKESRKNIDLSDLQRKSLDEIHMHFESKQVVLLHGITGSGKTEIYCRLIEETLKEGKQVLFLVPEIALTTQLIYRVRNFFGERVGVYHSKFSENERVEIWNSVAGNVSTQDTLKSHINYDVVLGARSALLLPFTNLGLIIVDEEHDSSYKQHDVAPRYHARDSAIYLAHLHHAKVILGSATPCLETYYNAKENKFGLVTLSQRFGAASMPEIEAVDTRSEDPKAIAKHRDKLFTPRLIDEIKIALDKKEQVILFQNRRGFAPYTECNTCNWVPHCVQCDVAMIYHKSSGRLVCHYCGYSMQPPSTCAACGNSDLRYKGFGTEKIEEEIEILFPEVKTARMDLDSTRSKYAYKQLLDDFEQGNVDILIGTQMVTKGLDFDNVSLVGVISADQALNFPDFRTHEKAFQLMTQVSGRAGRKDVKGKVIIQTSQPQHAIIHLVKEHDYQQFYQLQMQDRQQFHYPPFFRIIEFTLISKDLFVLNEGSAQLAAELKKYFHERVLGPEFPLVARIRNEFHKTIMLKSEREFSSVKIREYVKIAIQDFNRNELNKKIRVRIDVDPV
ncbi:MAG: priA [Bacteroidetes bacterium]|jgi:primosomal protein N' (replication factor Y)|nr:priA [Bacteroidota bacterium]